MFLITRLSCDFFNQSNDYTTFYTEFSTTCRKFCETLTACVKFCETLTACRKFCETLTACVKFCVIITTCGKFYVIICGVAKGGVIGGFPYALSNSFPSCCDISAILSCKTSA